MSCPGEWTYARATHCGSHTKTSPPCSCPNTVMDAAHPHMHAMATCQLRRATTPPRSTYTSSVLRPLLSMTAFVSLTRNTSAGNDTHVCARTPSGVVLIVTAEPPPSGSHKGTRGRSTASVSTLLHSRKPHRSTWRQQNPASKIHDTTQQHALGNTPGGPCARAHRKSHPCHVQPLDPRLSSRCSNTSVTTGPTNRSSHPKSPSTLGNDRFHDRQCSAKRTVAAVAKFKPPFMGSATSSVLSPNTMSCHGTHTHA